jgi:drug/metabolite transporter (DMT)-like permease
MFSYIWPIALAILSNVLYHICAKTTPEGVHPFASLTVTYLTGAVLSAILYYVLAPQANLVKECSRLNWAPFALGIVIVGLEGGWLYAYKAGWQVNTGFIVQSAFVSVLLLFVGYFLYREALSWNKLLGTAICLLGLVFINLN